MKHSDRPGTSPDQKFSRREIESVRMLVRRDAEAIRMLAKRRQRHAEKRFIVEGLRAVEQMLGNRQMATEMLVADPAGLQKMQNSLELGGRSGVMHRDSSVPVYKAEARTFRQLSQTQSNQGILAICRMPESLPPDKMLEQNGLILAVDRIQDPGNLGTMIRTAVWFGVAGLVVSSGTVDLFHPKLVRSTAGSTGVLPWLEMDLSNFLDKAISCDWNIILLDAGPDATSYRQVHSTGKDIIVAGNEANGLDQCLLEDPRFQTIRIDSGPAEDRPLESLNVSIATAVLFSEISRYRVE